MPLKVPPKSDVLFISDLTRNGPTTNEEDLRSLIEIVNNLLAQFTEDCFAKGLQRHALVSRRTRFELLFGKQKVIIAAQNNKSGLQIRLSDANTHAYVILKGSKNLENPTLNLINLKGTLDNIVSIFSCVDISWNENLTPIRHYPASF
jgi:hypothetical protein